ERLPCVIFEKIDTLLHFAQRFLEDLAFLVRHRAGDLFLVFEAKLDRLRDNAAAGRRGRVAPGRERLLGRVDRRLGFFTRGLRRMSDEVVGIGGVDVGDRLARGRIEPLTIDKVAVLTWGSVWFCDGVRLSGAYLCGHAVG